MPSHISFEEVCEIVAPLARRYDAQRAAHEAEARSYRGVTFGGWSPGPFVEKTPGQLIAEQRADDARRASFNRSPRGRFLAHLRTIEQTNGWNAEAYAARAAYSRGFSDSRKAPDVAEVAHAIHALAGIPSADARECIAALAEILIGERQEAA
jgi:hypothetical protein